MHLKTKDKILNSIHEVELKANVERFMWVMWENFFVRVTNVRVTNRTAEFCNLCSLLSCLNDKLWTFPRTTTLPKCLCASKPMSERFADEASRNVFQPHQFVMFVRYSRQIIYKEKENWWKTSPWYNYIT